jgi:hypothetical protein
MLVFFNEAHKLWLEFVLAAKADFRKNWKSKCDWTKPEYQKKA